MEELTENDLNLLAKAYATKKKSDLEKFIAQADTFRCKARIAGYMRFWEHYLI